MNRVRFPFCQLVFLFSASLCFQSAASQDQAPVMPSQRLDRKIQKLVSEVSADRIAATLKKLESFETRNTMSDPNQPGRGVGAARQWIFDELKGYSPRLQVRFDTHLLPKEGTPLERSRDCATCSRCCPASGGPRPVDPGGGALRFAQPAPPARAARRPGEGGRGPRPGGDRQRQRHGVRDGVRPRAQRVRVRRDARVCRVRR